VQQHQLQNTLHSSQGSLTTVATSYYQTAPAHYHAQHEQLSVPKNTDYINISEPADEEDDDILLVAAPEIENDVGEAAYYRPFRYAVGSRLVTKKSGKKAKRKEETVDADVDSEPLDLLATLLSGPVGDSTDIARMIEVATEKSIRARNLTRDLVRRHSHLVNDKRNTDEAANDEDNHAYATASNCHAEAAFSYQKVYRILLGLGQDCSYLSRRLNSTAALSPSEELAKSMLILANAHASRAKSLGTMGEKWNLGKVEPTGLMSNGNRAAKINDEKEEEVKSTASNESSSSDRLRACVRGALEITNREADMTTSTFLARSVAKESARSSNRSDLATKEEIDGAKHGTVGGNNPVDDLMKLEKELRTFDMSLDMNSSVASLGAASAATRPDGSFCVVPPGSSYMSSSSMWTSGVLSPGANKQHKPKHKPQHPRPNIQKGMTTVKSKNQLQGFMAGTSKPAPQANTKGIHANAALDQSWWGGGQGSILASSAISTAAASHQRPSPIPGGGVPQPSTNTKQLMQLMDSLNRLGNENAELLREVEDAKAARLEAKATKEMMSKFKVEYSQRFSKVKEALKKVPQTGEGNPVLTSAYMKSASAAEIAKRDQMIKQLSNDLRRERGETKRMTSTLQKYETFYREVKARSAEKARQRQLAEQKQQPPS